MVTRTRWRRRAAAGVAVASGGLLASTLSSLSFTPVVQGSPSHSPPFSPSAPPRKTIHLLIDGGQKDWISRKATVEEALAEAGVELGPKDEVFPDLDQPLWDGLPIFVCRVRTAVVARDVKISYHIMFEPAKSRWQRLPVITRRGKPGLLRKRYEIVYRDGRATERNLLETRVLRPAVCERITAPTRYQLASRGYYGGRRVFRMVATAYDPGPGSCGPAASGKTAIGLRAGHGIVAVDPQMIPMKARIYVEGYGYAVAGDIGSAIKGNRIDLGFRSRSQALRYGRRPVTVRVLE
jgi:3D (Asp-Asp-Asp) domain-containing protein